MDFGIILTIDDMPRRADAFANIPRYTASITSDQGAACTRHRVAYNPSSRHRG
jgi:hypothetical protein